LLYRDVNLNPLPVEMQFEAPSFRFSNAEAYYENVTAMARACLFAFDQSDQHMAALFSRGLLMTFQAS